MKKPDTNNNDQSKGDYFEKYKSSDYDYTLPEELIAQRPLERRDQSRMMVIDRKKGTREHAIFNKLPLYLEEGDLLILNNTKVIPARLKGRIVGKTTEAELLLLHKLPSGNWMAMVKPGKKLQPGTRIEIRKDIEAVIQYSGREGLRAVSFSAPAPIESMLHYLGEVPLPPYIKSELDDPGKYQTIYAKKKGSAAAPTAGFHFTSDVFAALDYKGIKYSFITLHIGPGTFQPVKTEDIRDHVMHREYYRLDKKIARQIYMAKQENKRVIAVGTSVCRVLESVADSKGFIKGQEMGWTDLFIYPGFKFRVIDGLITNFHLPRSTLLMLVSAFAGYEETVAAYREAVEQNYRFYSFGDCMLIYNKEVKRPRRRPVSIPVSMTAGSIDSPVRLI